MKFYTTSLNPNTAPNSLVFLLHGWGATGEDLLSLALEWQEKLPQTLFICPEAPQVCDQNPFGFQWFSLGDWSVQAMSSGAQSAVAALDDFIKKQCESHNVSADRCVIMGFSQGMMIALLVGLQQSQALAGILGYSGGLFGIDAARLASFPKTDVCLVHGTDDPVVPVQMHDAAMTILQGLDYNVQGHKIPRLAHGIDPKGLKIGADFLIKHLG